MVKLIQIVCVLKSQETNRMKSEVNLANEVSRELSLLQKPTENLLDGTKNFLIEKLAACMKNKAL